MCPYYYSYIEEVSNEDDHTGEEDTHEENGELVNQDVSMMTIIIFHLLRSLPTSPPSSLPPSLPLSLPPYLPLSFPLTLPLSLPLSPLPPSLPTSLPPYLFLLSLRLVNILLQ